MSLVFAGLVPHPPILIPAIGKDNLDQIEKTEKAMRQMEQELYSTKPDILMIISPHGEIDPTAFTINLSDKYTMDFEDFGDFATKLEAKGEVIEITRAKETIADKVPLNIISETDLDHGVAVPYFYLAQHLENTGLIPVHFSLLNNQAHLDFGKALKEVIMSSRKRIAVIASGDMSHCLTQNAPAGFNPAGKEFDELLIELLKQADTKGIVSLDSKLVEQAAECGYRSILILLGILNNMSYKTEVLSYEAPFGVGYLVANLKLT